MTSQLTRLSLFATALLCGLYSAPASAQTRTWVSGVGDDLNPCSRTAPCKTFAGAISKTAAGGEINCIDPGGFGTVTITKSITIDCDGTIGSMLSSGTNGVNVNDSATGTPGNINVILRNLTINGTTTGFVGVSFISGRSVTLENVKIFGFNGGGVNSIGVRMTTNVPNAVLLIDNSSIRSNGNGANGGGIVITPGASGTNALVTVSNSIIQRNGGAGIHVNTTSGSAIVTVHDSTISNNNSGGIRAQAGGSLAMMVDRVKINSNSAFGISAENAAASVRVGSSAIHGNAVGMQALAGATLRSYKDNKINGNGGGEGPFTQEGLQ